MLMLNALLGSPAVERLRAICRTYWLNETNGLFMERDTRDEALEKIQDVVNFLAASYELPAEVSKGLQIIEALTRHGDLPEPLSPEENEWLAKIKGAALD